MDVPYCVRLKGGVLPVGAVVVDRDQIYITIIINAATCTRTERYPKQYFPRVFEPNKKEDPIAAMQRMHKNAQNQGCTAKAMSYLEKYTDVPAEWRDESVALGTQKLGIDGKDIVDMPTPAPRKLSGAALAAKRKKEEREAREAEAAYANAAQEAANKHSKDAQKKAAEKPAAKKKPAPKPKAKPAPKKAAPKPKAPATKTAKDPGNVETYKKADGDWRSASAMFKGLLITGGKTDKQIFAQVKKKFGLGDDKFSYVAWNRNDLRKKGVEVEDAR